MTAEFAAADPATFTEPAAATASVVPRQRGDETGTVGQGGYLVAADEGRWTAARRRRTAIDLFKKLRAHLDHDRLTNIGFPSALREDVKVLLPLFGYVLNNIGNPSAPTAFPANTKRFEADVVAWAATLMRAPADDFWGYVTSGSAEAIAWALLRARERNPSGIVYYSTAAHVCVPFWIKALGMRGVAIDTDPTGALRPAAFQHAIRQRWWQHRILRSPAVVIATIGTTMTEAIDDIDAINEVLDHARVPDRYIHADAALSGIPLALLPDGQRPAFTLDRRVDSASFSGHKFLGAKNPCGVLVTRRSAIGAGWEIDYVNTVAATLSSSRSGHNPLLLWNTILHAGQDGLRAQAEQARAVAAHAVERLNHVGVNAWRNPHAMTVVLDRPSDDVIATWRLATSGLTSHLICVPGVTTDQIDDLCAHITASRSRDGTSPMGAPTQHQVTRSVLRSRSPEGDPRP